MGQAIKSVGGLLFGGGGDYSKGNEGLQQVQAQQLAAAQQAANSLKDIQPQQSEFAQALAQGALGKGPSLADAQMKLAMDRSLQQQLAAAQAQRGANPALAGRNAAMGAARTNADIAGQTASARLAEQRQQQGAFQQYLGGQQQYQVGALGGAGQAAGSAASAEAARRQADQGLVGGLLQAGGALGAAYMGKGAKAPATVAHGGAIEAPEVVPGDHPANDIVPAMLSGGEVVVPKTVVEKGGKAAGEFVEALKAHMESKERLKTATFGDVLMARNKGGKNG